jgi:hypothetical protein
MKNDLKGIGRDIFQGQVFKPQKADRDTTQCCRSRTNEAAVYTEIAYI